MSKRQNLLPDSLCLIQEAQAEAPEPSVCGETLYCATRLAHHSNYIRLSIVCSLIVCLLHWSKHKTSSAAIKGKASNSIQFVQI